MKLTLLASGYASAQPRQAPRGYLPTRDPIEGVRIG
jgi:hypothetical protein